MSDKKISKRTIWIIIVAVLAVILGGMILLTVFHAQEDTAGAGESSAASSTTTIPETSIPETSVPETTVPEETSCANTTPVTACPYVAYSPLTGEGLLSTSENRPYAIVFNNIKYAQPQYGVSQADILCEILVEGTTRCVGIFYDFEGVETFGSIRSARPYLVSIAQSFDAIFVHAGRSTECQEYLNSTGWDHIDGVHGSGASKYYYRNKDRINAGYAIEHTMFIKPDDVVAYAKKMKCTLTRDGGMDYGWKFAEGSAATKGKTAETITAWFSLGSSTSSYTKSTKLEYNAEDGLYYASQYGSAYKDAANDQQLCFRNVLFLRAKTASQGDKSGHLTITLTGSGTGYYACGGKLIPIKWSRKSTSDPFTFTLEDGTELTLSTGKTYIGFVSTKATVKYE